MTTDTLKALLSKKTLSSADKAKINKAYKAQFGRKPKTATSCSSCYHDAVVELYSSLAKGAHLRSGVVINYKGKLYNKYDYPLPVELIELHRDKIHIQ